MTKIAAIAFENSPRKIFMGQLLLTQRLKLASLLLDGLLRQIRQINDGGSMVKLILVLTLIAATPSVFGSAKQHSHSELGGIAAKALEERARARGLDAVTVEIFPLDSRVNLPKCGKAVTVLSESNKPSLGRVTVGIRCQTPEPWTIYLRGACLCFSGHSRPSAPSK